MPQGVHYALRALDHNVVDLYDFTNVISLSSASHGVSERQARLSVLTSDHLWRLRCRIDYKCYKV